ncbi:MAG TPA: cytochrome c [Solirubrobacteraceae bacterium]|nr:cytochrome c [Solirubrobacteraceae bacterium]
MLINRRKGLVRISAIVLVVTSGAVGLAACGGSSGSSSTSSGAGGGSSVTKATTGRAIFQAAGCAQCHTLKAAGATGAVGPNLDSLKPSAAKVRSQVERGGGVMPSFKDKLTAAQIDAVANFVASSAGH